MRDVITPQGFYRWLCAQRDVPTGHKMFHDAFAPLPTYMSELLPDRDDGVYLTGSDYFVVLDRNGGEKCRRRLPQWAVEWQEAIDDLESVHQPVSTTDAIASMQEFMLDNCIPILESTQE